MGDRERSRSPRRRDFGDRDRPKKTGGFRWKEKRRDDDSRGDDRRLDRGYRDRSDRPRSPRRDRDAERTGDRHRDSPREYDSKRRDARDAPREDREKKAEKRKRGEKASDTTVIRAYDCELFKAQVAARIGREPHEILLKRQGERPFKDQLTLEDYGVSNGVQLDLEVGTGD
ncbi:hypothetical protein POX_b02828 [Penicillium oxalicum]|uniref:hypothetical protein n=1 Tax=Penicillium oxalicum TaxID=69781 RepID=UPI0020B6CF84|nr:hypothetical protein POX_b02828 [Penicillium oxalicum]KAI2792785.1 hypothetical protein POX_b02828 [Penicillium oxalicum]